MVAFLSFLNLFLRPFLLLVTVAASCTIAFVSGSIEVVVFQQLLLSGNNTLVGDKLPLLIVVFFEVSKVLCSIFSANAVKGSWAQKFYHRVSIFFVAVSFCSSLAFSINSLVPSQVVTQEYAVSETTLGELNRSAYDVMEEKFDPESDPVLQQRKRSIAYYEKILETYNTSSLRSQLTEEINRYNEEYLEREQAFNDNRDARLAALNAQIDAVKAKLEENPMEAALRDNNPYLAGILSSLAYLLTGKADYPTFIYLLAVIIFSLTVSIGIELVIRIGSIILSLSDSQLYAIIGVDDPNQEYHTYQMLWETLIQFCCVFFTIIFFSLILGFFWSPSKEFAIVPLGVSALISVVGSRLFPVGLAIKNRFVKLIASTGMSGAVLLVTYFVIGSVTGSPSIELNIPQSIAVCLGAFINSLVQISTAGPKNTPPNSNTQ